MHACYPHLPLEPGANFPSDVRDDGAFPPEPYDFAFWGFPCIKHSSLNRTATEADLVDALEKFCARVRPRSGGSLVGPWRLVQAPARNSSRTCDTSLLTQGPHVTNGRFRCCRCRSRAAAAGCTREQ